MPGGARPGAGRKKGSPNKASIARQRAIAKSGLTPLQFMLRLMRDEGDEAASIGEKIAFHALRFEAAKAAAPYVHPKLSSTEISGPGGAPLAPPVINFYRESRPD